MPLLIKMRKMIWLSFRQRGAWLFAQNLRGRKSLLQGRVSNTTFKVNITIHFVNMVVTIVAITIETE